MSDETWTEVKITSDGVSVTVYKETADLNSTVVDEFWMTHSEMEDSSNLGSYVLDE